MTPCKNHKYFKTSDFTEAEVIRRNLLAIAVIRYNAQICKQCGYSSMNYDDAFKAIGDAKC